jgi:hypothetical protein
MNQNNDDIYDDESGESNLESMNSEKDENVDEDECFLKSERDTEGDELDDDDGEEDDDDE